MSSLRRFFSRLAAFLRLSRAEHDLSREIRAHLQLLEDRYIADGMTPQDARFAALRVFGGVEQTKEHQRDARSFRWLDNARTDLKLGARMLVKYPTLTIVGGAGLAVAIAIGASFFAFFHAYLYSTLPIDEGERVVALENWDLTTNNEERRQSHDFIRWQSMRTVEDLSAFRNVNRNLIVPGGPSEPVRVAEISPSAFRLTRIAPLLGRPLVEADAAAGAPPVIVIGHEAWQSRFASDPAIVGREIRLGSSRYTVVGVMPGGYAFPVNHQFWIPLRIDPRVAAPKTGPAIFVFARLAPGATLTSAQAELSALGAQAATDFPVTHGQLRPRVMAYAYPILDIQDVFVWQVAMFQGMVSMLLVIVAVNVAALIYARTATRHGELAVRSALGASRGRIVGQLFLEALALSAGAAGAGLLLAKVGLSQAHGIMEAEGGSLPYWIDTSIPVAAIAYVVGLAVLAAVIAGFLPALHATGRHVQSTLQSLGGGTGVRLGPTWTTLIVAQVGLAVAGLPAAISLFGWHQISVSATTPSYESEAYLTAYVSMDPEPPAGVDPVAYTKERDQRFAKFRTDLSAAIESEAIVEDVTIASAPPGREARARIEIEDGAARANVRFGQIDLDYFDAFDAAVVSGRRFTASDAGTATNPVIVNRAFVHQVLRDGPAIGRRLRYVEDGDTDADDSDPTRWHEIVGVAADLQTNAIDPTQVAPTVFHPLEGHEPRAAFLVRARGNGGTFAGRLRELAVTLDPTVRVVTLTMSDIHRQSTLATRLVLMALLLIVVSVLLLAAAGIYAMISFTVSQRRKEIGIRVAMGANPMQIVRGVFARAAVQLASGLVAGVALALVLDSASGGEVLGQSGRVTLPAVAIVIIVVGLAAAVGPARRGLHIQPTDALRE